MTSRVKRAVSVYREHGIEELQSRSRDFVRHGLIRRHVIPNVPLPLHTFRGYLRTRQLICNEAYTNRDPFALYYVDPTEIEYISGNSLFYGQYKPLHWGKIEGGDWDRREERFDELPVPKSIILHHQEGVPWEETPLIEGIERRKNSTAARWDTELDFDGRVTDIERLMEAIRDNGYRSKRDLVNSGSIGTVDPIPPLVDEVTIDIGRDGRPLFRFFGVHRLAIARVLGLDEIPTLVGSWHEDVI